MGLMDSVRGGLASNSFSGVAPSACRWIGGIADEASPVHQERIIQRIEESQRTSSKYGAIMILMLLSLRFKNV